MEALEWLPIRCLNLLLCLPLCICLLASTLSELQVSLLIKTIRLDEATSRSLFIQKRPLYLLRIDISISRVDETPAWFLGRKVFSLLWFWFHFAAILSRPFRFTSALLCPPDPHTTSRRDELPIGV